MRPLLVATDVGAIFAAGWIVGLRGEVFEVLSFMCISLVACRLAGLHRSRLEFAVLDELPAYLEAALFIVTALVCSVAIWTGTPPGIGQTIAFGVLTLTFTIAGRLAVYSFTRLMRSRRHVSHPVVIVGAGRVGQRIARALLDHPSYGLKPLGFIDTDPQVNPRDLPLPVLDSCGSVSQVLKDLDVTHVVFADTTSVDTGTMTQARACMCANFQVFIVPRFFELMAKRDLRNTEVVSGIPLLRLHRWPLRPSRARIKRTYDVTFSAIALVLLAPVLAACAIAVRLESGPGVIFRQERIGRNGRAFMLFKFRSYRPSASSESDVRWSIDGEAQIGPVGRFLRRSSLDELPQIYNILRGDMSIVGPRPERPFFVDKFQLDISHYTDRHRIDTGLTGLAQINGLRGNTSIEDRVHFDNYYIETWSLWGDFKIVLRTVSTVFRNDSAPKRITAGGGKPLYLPRAARMN